MLITPSFVFHCVCEPNIESQPCHSQLHKKGTFSSIAAVFLKKGMLQNDMKCLFICWFMNYRYLSTTQAYQSTAFDGVGPTLCIFQQSLVKKSCAGEPRKWHVLLGSWRCCLGCLLGYLISSFNKRSGRCSARESRVPRRPPGAGVFIVALLRAPVLTSGQRTNLF